MGAPISTVPFACSATKETCDGPYESVWVKVWNTAGVIDEVDVIYYGKKLDSTVFEAPGGNITLAQAVKIHSFGSGCERPAFSMGKDKAGVQVVDYVNHRLYMTTGAVTDSRVLRVIYYSPSDASFAAAAEHPDVAGTTILLKAADVAPPYGTETPEHKLLVQGMDPRIANVKQAGEMVAIELRIAQDEKDRNGSYSKKSIDDVIALYAAFQEAQEDLLDFMGLYKDAIAASDKAKMPTAFIEEIDSKFKKFSDETPGR